MSLRVRVSGEILCGAKSEAEPDDCYIDDGLHYRLSVLYGVVIPEPDEDASGRWRWATESEWDRVRANRPDCVREDIDAAEARGREQAAQWHDKKAEVHARGALWIGRNRGAAI